MTVTEQRDLKQLVRDRMARTGESYTTARRHVVARAGRTADGADTAGSHGPSVQVAYLLRQAGHVAPHTGLPYSEAMVCGLAGGIGFMYAVFDYRGLAPMVTLVMQHHPEPWASSALGRLGIGFTEAHSTSARSALAALRTELDAGRAVYCVAGGAGGFPADPAPYVVVGTRDGDLLVDDGLGAPRRVDVDEFMAAWSAYRKGRHHRMTVSTEPHTVDLPAAIRAALATTVAHLTGPVLGNAFDVNFGLSGMGRLADQVRDARTKTGWARRFTTPADLAVGLRRLHACIEREFTAPGGTRPLYAEFLDEAAGVLGDVRLTAAAERYRDAGDAWSALAAAALTAAGSADAAVLPGLADLADAALAIEREALAIIADG
jgi:hypothetical protein